MSSVTLCVRAKRAAQTIIKPVSENYLNCEVTTAAPPDFVSNVFYHIIKDEGQDDKHLFEDLVYLQKCAAPVPGISLSVGVAMLEIIDAKFWERMMNELLAASVRIEDIVIADLVLLYPAYDNLIDAPHAEFDNCIGSHYIFGVSLYMTVIGKYLLSNNYPHWMRRRKASFAQPLGLPADDPKLSVFTPVIQVCQSFNRESRALWQIRREIFCEIWTQSRGSSFLARGFKVTVILLRYAEFSNFQFPWNWIVILNPVLLMWAELNRDLPYLTAAFAKYYSIGDLAPWAKLILPPEQLEEFASPKLNNLYQVAKAIAGVYGPQIISQTDSTSKSSYLQDLCNKAIVLVRASGTARTVDAAALIRWKYGDHQNTELMSELSKGLAGSRHDEDDVNDDLGRRVDQ